MPEPTPVTKEWILQLEKTVAALDDRVKHLQAGLGTATVGSPAKRFWVLTGSRQTRAFMSSVCNQHIRPNTKVMAHVIEKETSIDYILVKAGTQGVSFDRRVELSPLEVLPHPLRVTARKVQAVEARRVDVGPCDGALERGDRGERGERNQQQQGGRRDQQQNQNRRNEPRNEPRDGQQAQKAPDAVKPEAGHAAPATAPQQKQRQPQPPKSALEAHPPAVAGEEGEGRGRRRRRGGRGRDREGREGRNAQAEGAAPMPASVDAATPVATPAPQAFMAPVEAAPAMPAATMDAPAPILVAAAPVTPRAEEVSAPQQPQLELSAPVVEAPAAPPAPAPVAAPAPAAVVSTFVAIDQIPDAERQASQQQRRRPRHSDANMASEPLVFIETAADKVQQAVLVEDEAPRRSAPRPRKAKPVVNEPLVFVETGKSNANQPDQGNA